MPTQSEKAAALLQELLKRRGKLTPPTDRLGLERPAISGDFENEPMAGWEKAAALIGAAVSPVSTIASTVLAPPPEETIFDRAITGPDGKLEILPETLQSVVPRMKKAQRKTITPNPVVAALQRLAQKGPLNDPANDIIHQKINDRNFLVHATRPEDAKHIRELGGIMPSIGALPRSVLRDPVIKNAVKAGNLHVKKGFYTSDKPSDIIRKDMRRYPLEDTIKDLGKPELDPQRSPGVSLSRQMSVPELNPDKSYRFLLDPSARSTFPTAEKGFKKKYADVPSGFPPSMLRDSHESEQRTFGTPYPVKRANRAIVSENSPKSPIEEYVSPEKVDYYRATMGNENIKKLQERLGVGRRGSRNELWDEYQKLEKLGSDLYDQLQGLKATDPFYKTTLAAWMDATKKAKEAGDKYYGVKSKSLMPDIPKPAPAPKADTTPGISNTIDAYDDWIDSKFPGWKELITKKKQLTEKYIKQINDPKVPNDEYLKTTEEFNAATNAVTEFMKKMNMQ